MAKIVITIPNYSAVELWDHNQLNGKYGGSPWYHLNQNEYDRFKDLIYVDHETSFSLSPLTGEKGVNQEISVNVKIDSNDDEITYAFINQGIGNILPYVDDDTHGISQTVSNNVTYTLYINYIKNGETSAETTTTTYTAYTPQFAGFSSATDYTTYSALAAALQKYVQSGTKITKSMSPTNQYIWFVSNNPNTTIYDNNMFAQTVGNWNDTTKEFWKKSITLTLANGSTTSTVYLFRSRDTKTFSNFNYTLKLPTET